LVLIQDERERTPRSRATRTGRKADTTGKRPTPRPRPGADGPRTAPRPGRPPRGPRRGRRASTPAVHVPPPRRSAQIAPRRPRGTFPGWRGDIRAGPAPRGTTRRPGSSSRAAGTRPGVSSSRPGNLRPHDAPEPGIVQHIFRIVIIDEPVPHHGP